MLALCQELGHAGNDGDNTPLHLGELPCLSQPATGRKGPQDGEDSTVTGEGARLGQQGEQGKLS